MSQQVVVAVETAAHDPSVALEMLRRKHRRQLTIFMAEEILRVSDQHPGKKHVRSVEKQDGSLIGNN
jgi:hypothetical protein